MEDPQELKATKEKLEAQLSDVNRKLAAQESNRILREAEADEAWENLSWSERMKVRESNPEAYEMRMQRMQERREHRLVHGVHGHLPTDE